MKGGRKKGEMEIQLTGRGREGRDKGREGEKGEE